ncbi:hypothetical protein ACWC24_32625 [Streptomyces sp. NPDC001443]
MGSHLRALAAWSYPDPRPPYEDLRNHVAFYAPGESTAAASTATRCSPSKATSTEAGSPPRSVAPSREEPTPTTGDRTNAQAPLPHCPGAAAAGSPPQAARRVFRRPCHRHSGDQWALTVGRGGEETSA